MQMSDDLAPTSTPNGTFPPFAMVGRGCCTSSSFSSSSSYDDVLSNAMRRALTVVKIDATHTTLGTRRKAKKESSVGPSFGGSKPNSMKLKEEEEEEMKTRLVCPSSVVCLSLSPLLTLGGKDGRMKDQRRTTVHSAKTEATSGNAIRITLETV